MVSCSTASAILEHETPSQVDKEKNLNYLLKNIPNWDLKVGPPTPQSAALQSVLSHQYLFCYFLFGLEISQILGKLEGIEEKRKVQIVLKLHLLIS